MAVEREKGYEYKGWKLGEIIRHIEDEKEYTIIGFDEKEDEEYFIAIDRNGWNKNIKNSNTVTSCINANSNIFDWVLEDEIEKIESDVENAKNQQQVKILQEKEAKIYVYKNFKDIKAKEYDACRGLVTYYFNDVKCILEEYEAYDVEYIIKNGIKINEDTTKVEDNITKEENNDYIKPNYYKINVAGAECEVKDVIKATVKDYDSVLVANIIKYIMRYRGKNGLEDLKKARTYLEELISIMENNNDRKK